MGAARNGVLSELGESLLLSLRLLPRVWEADALTTRPSLKVSMSLQLLFIFDLYRTRAEPETWIFFSSVKSPKYHTSNTRGIIKMSLKRFLALLLFL